MLNLHFNEILNDTYDNCTYKQHVSKYKLNYSYYKLYKGLDKVNSQLRIPGRKYIIDNCRFTFISNIIYPEIPVNDISSK